MTRNNPTLIAADAGYGYTKLFDSRACDVFPSVLGYPERLRYEGDLMGHTTTTEGTRITVDGRDYYVGELALTQSSVNWTPQKRDGRAETTVALILAGQARRGISGEVQLVTGLPVNWFMDDKDDLQERLADRHTYQLQGKPEREVDFIDLVVMPQPFGSHYFKTLGRDGSIADPALAQMKSGYCDIGTNTTDFLTTQKFGFVQPESGSLQAGMATIYNLAGQLFEEKFEMELELHEIDQVVRQGKIRVAGEDYPVYELLEPIIQAVARKILDRAEILWRDGGRHLDRIFITGGGAGTIGPYLTERYPHADIIDYSATANVLGFHRYGLNKWGRSQPPSQSAKTKPAARRNERPKTKTTVPAAA